MINLYKSSHCFLLLNDICYWYLDLPNQKEKYILRMHFALKKKSKPYLIPVTINKTFKIYPRILSKILLY